MADVKIIDIDNEQWNIKDQEARGKIATLEETVSVKDLQNVEIKMKPGYTASTKNAYNHYSVGKIHFMTIKFGNLSGYDIGTGSTANVASINLYPKKDTTFILYDYMNKAILRCYLHTDGTIVVGESLGVVQGNNSCFGELIFAEK